VSAIANGIGTRQVESVEQSELINETQAEIFLLDLDMVPSSQLTGDEENPVEFEWEC